MKGGRAAFAAAALAACLAGADCHPAKPVGPPGRSVGGPMIIPETTVGRIGPWRLGVGATFQDDAYVDASGSARRGPTALVSLMRKGAGPDAERQVTVGAGAEIVLDETTRVRIVRVDSGEEGFVEVQQLR